jgi:predicted component of type VI protein secretion system
LQSNLSWLQRAFSSSTTLKERLSGDKSSLTSESEMCHEALPMRQRPVKSVVLRLGLSSFSELEESSLEKSRSLRAAHAQDIIF